MADLILTAPLDREAIQITTDVNTVRITELVNIDLQAGAITFRYEEGRVSGSSFIRETLSDNILASGSGFTEILAAAVDAGKDLLGNIETVLLQYLIDQGIVGAGTIS